MFTAYAATPPTILAMLLPAYQSPCRNGCSVRLYHMPVISENPGATAASIMPKKNRDTISPANEVADAVHIKTVAQRILVNVVALVSHFDLFVGSWNSEVNKLEL